MNVQLVPEPFVEVPYELAQSMGLQGARKSKLPARAAITSPRPWSRAGIRPMKIDGKEMFQIGIPIHWGFRGIAKTRTRQPRPWSIS